MTKTAGNYKKIEMFEKIKLKTANLRTKPTNFILWAMMFTVYTEPMSAIYILWTNPYLLEERVVCDLAHFFCLFSKFSFSEFNTEGIYFLILSTKTCFSINQPSFHTIVICLEYILIIKCCHHFICMLHSDANAVNIHIILKQY